MCDSVSIPFLDRPSSSSSISSVISRSWSQWARICSSSRRTLASRRPRLSSGWEWTMLWRAAAALARAALLPLVLPSNPESLSLPWRSWTRRGRHPATKTNKCKHFVLLLLFYLFLGNSHFKQGYFQWTKLSIGTVLFILGSFLIFHCAATTTLVLKRWLLISVVILEAGVNWTSAKPKLAGSRDLWYHSHSSYAKIIQYIFSPQTHLSKCTT